MHKYVFDASAITVKLAVCAPLVAVPTICNVGYVLAVVTSTSPDPGLCLSPTLSSVAVVVPGVTVISKCRMPPTLQVYAVRPETVPSPVNTGVTDAGAVYVG